MDASTGGGRAFTLPRVSTPLPGPRSARLFATADAVLCGPHARARRRAVRRGAQERLADRGRRRQHLRRPRLGLGVDASRRAPGGVPSAAAEAQDRYGMEITDYVMNEPALALARRLVEIAPARHHPCRPEHQRHRGRRGRREARPRGDGATDDPRLPRPVPRRVHLPHGRRQHRPLRGDQQRRPVRLGHGVRALPEPLQGALPQGSRPLRRHALRRLHRGVPARPPGRTRSRSPACSSSPSSARAASWRRRRRSGSGSPASAAGSAGC